MGSFHVHVTDSSSAEKEVLVVANEYRAALVSLTHQRHQSFIELRNELFPDLFSALCRYESCCARIWQIEAEIKRHHSEVLDRNAVTDEQAENLQEQRGIREHLGREIKRLRLAWSSTMRAFSLYWQRLADWKNIKTLAKRKELYAALDDFPAEIEPYVLLADEQGKELPGLVGSTLPRYASLWMEHDLLERELNAEFSPRLHPAIRAEIVEASQPKLTKTSPGIRYEYHRVPNPKPWTKLTIQFSGGGLSLDKALSGTSGFSLRLLSTLHKARADKSIYEVTQQIGTKANPALITYSAKIHRPFAEDAVLKRWSLIVDGKRSCVPLVATEITRPHTGTGAFRYSLSWTKRKSGIEVARFEGTHINERLIIPHWLVERRLALKATQQATDLVANELLTERGLTPPPKQKQGVEALAVYVAANPDDVAAANNLDQCQCQRDRATRVANRALKAIEQIYHVAARRVCDLHAEHQPCDLDLATLKRYNTRDLLRKDVIPVTSRENLFAVAPGKLKQFIAAQKLPVASVEVMTTLPVVARDTDIITSYVADLGNKTGSKRNEIRRCSRTESQLSTT